MISKYYELMPRNGRKSFYGKAVIKVENETETLYSYGTPIVRRERDGTLVRLWDDWTYTTGAHIKSFCGLNKAQFEKLRYERTENE